MTVIKCLRQLVAHDHASCRALQNGIVWFRLHTGEIFLLEEKHILRIT